jgi:hypothetical protein
MPRISLPHEHGGSVTAAAAGIAAVALAPAPVPALGVGVAVMATFLARGPLDRIAARLSLRAWDLPAIVLLAATVLASAAVVGARSPVHGLATLGLCALMLAGSALARSARKQRAVLLEVFGMAGLGASAGLGLLAAGAPGAVAAAAALVLATHAAVSVPIVRTELRKRERPLGQRSVGIAASVVAAAATLLIVLGQPLMAVALAPRAGHLLLRATGLLPIASSPGRSAIRETVLLAACVLLVVAFA